MSNRFDLTRRGFLKVMGGVGASFALGSFAAISCAESPKLGAVHREGPTFSPNAYVKIDPDGWVTISIAKSDMGQGVRTSLAMLVAEELDADWKKVRVEQAATDSKLFGRQGTGGSSSIRSMNGPLRKMGGVARMMLVMAAAKQWGVAASECTTDKGVVNHAASGKSIGYGELTALAAAVPVPADVTLKDPKDFKIVGKPTTRVDNVAVATGKAKFGLDARTPNMVFATIARPPAFGSSVASVDDSAARKISGVIDVQSIGGSVAVIGSHTWAAISGRDALKIEWKPSREPDLSSAKISELLKAEVLPHYDLPQGAKVVEASFELPYLAHATMEPMNALADVRDDHCTVWTGTQVPDGAQRQIAQMLKIPAESVTINVQLLGGGFGRRLQTDFIMEAVRLSQTLKRPVQVVWTREDDMKHDFYRGACRNALKGVLDGDGKPIGWSHQAIQAGEGPNSEFGGAGLPYEIPNAYLRFSGIRNSVPTGPWRSVENTVLAVVNEMFVDHLAHAAGKDPFEFRMELIKDERLKNVMKIAAEKIGHGPALPSGHGIGFACFSGYGTCVAHAVELSVVGSKIKLLRMIGVVDCGMAINPKGVEAQIQGAMSDGIATAMRAEITIEKGGVVQNSWTDYKWITMDAMPKVEVFLVPSDAGPGGMGEPGYPSAPAAVANAVFAATGKKVSKLPIRIEELV